MLSGSVFSTRNNLQIVLKIYIYEIWSQNEGIPLLNSNKWAREGAEMMDALQREESTGSYQPLQKHCWLDNKEFHITQVSMSTWNWIHV